MKTLITKVTTLGSLALLMLASCKKEGTLATANTSTSAPTLTASATSMVLDKTKLSDPTIVETFTFTKPSFGYTAAVTNTLEVDVATDNWANPYSVAIATNALSQAFNTADFNNALLKAGATGGVSGKVNVRVKSALSATVFVYSNVLSLTLTPFNLKSWLYVPGAYEGWANPGPQEDSLYCATGNGIYVGIINFTAGNNQFLVTPQKNWNNKYATNDGASTSGTSSNYSVTYNGSNNFYAPATAGYYLVTLNINNNTMSIVPADFYSIIGDAALGWGTDVDLKYINDGNGNWATSTPVALVSTGSFKIREDHDWTYSWGIPKSGTDGFGVAGTLNNTSNDNIPVSINGNYAVTFNMPATARGTSPTKPASTTTTYSSVKQ